MIKNAHEQGRTAALRRFKLANLQQGAAGYNPTLNGQANSVGTSSAPSISPPSLKPPAPAAAPMAAGAAKSKVLG